MGVMLLAAVAMAGALAFSLRGVWRRVNKRARVVLGLTLLLPSVAVLAGILLARHHTITPGVLQRFGAALGLAAAVLEARDLVQWRRRRLGSGALLLDAGPTPQRSHLRLGVVLLGVSISGHILSKFIGHDFSLSGIGLDLAGLSAATAALLRARSRLELRQNGLLNLGYLSPWSKFMSYS